MDLRIVIIALPQKEQLWPLYTQETPKPFCRILSNDPLLLQTVHRYQHMGPITVVTIPSLLEQIKETLSHQPNITYIADEKAKHSAYAAFLAAKAFPDSEYLLITPSDHFIRDISPLTAGLEAAIDYAKQEVIVSFGITAAFPETHCSYMEMGNNHQLTRFITHPSLNEAKELYDQMHFFSSIGVFLAKPQTLIKEYENFKVSLSSFEKTIMEKTSNGVVIPLILDWNHLNSIRSIIKGAKLIKKANNRIFGDVEINDIEGSFLYASTKKLKAFGIENVICIETRHGVLLTHIDCVDRI